MEIITLLVASISFVVVIVTTVVYSRRTIDMKKNLDYQIMDVRKNVNDVTAENYKYDMKQQKDLELTNSNLADVKTAYATKSDLATKVTTESLEAKNLVAGSTTFKNIGASFDMSYNNSPTMAFSSGSGFTFKGSSPEFNLRSSGDLTADRNLVAGKSLMGKGLEVQGSTPGAWGGFIKNGGVMAEVANASGHGMRIKTDNTDTDKYGLRVDNGSGTSFMVGNDGSQSGTYTSSTNPGWSLYGPKTNVLIGGGDNGIIVNTNNTNASASGLQIYNGQQVVLDAANDGVVNIPGSTRTSSLRVNNVNGTSTVFGENNTNTIAGTTTFGGSFSVKNADNSQSSFGMNDPINTNMIRGKTNVNNIMMTDDWSNYPNSGVGRAEISSDMGNHKALVLGGVRGSTASTDKRKVKILDDLNVTNNLSVNGITQLGGALDVADNTVMHGNLTAKNIANKRTAPTDRLDISGTIINGSAMFNGLLFDSASGGIGIQPVGLAASPSEKVPAGEVRLMVRGSPAQAPVYTKLNAAADNKHYFEGPGSVFNTPVEVKQELNVGGNTKTNVLQLGDKFKLSGGVDQDEWLRILNNTADDYYGGLAASKIWAKDALFANSSAYVRGDIVFHGGNNWIVHTPDDGRRHLSITPSTDYDGFNWNWPNEIKLSEKGAVSSKEMRANVKDADAYPQGWGGGIMGFDIYSAGGTVGAGSAGGDLKAYMNSAGDMVATGKVTVNNTGGGDMICLNQSCLTEADIAKIKALP